VEHETKTGLSLGGFSGGVPNKTHCFGVPQSLLSGCVHVGGPGVQRLMSRTLADIAQDLGKTFGSSVMVTFDQFADLYIVEVNSQQQVIADKIDMQKFIGVRTYNVTVLHCYVSEIVFTNCHRLLCIGQHVFQCPPCDAECLTN